jgi:RNA polymerase sigma-70 factor (ECF subfamily)
LKLAIHQGVTHYEIAQSTELPLGTGKTHARRGLIRVRELLAGTGSEETARSRS